MVFGLQGRVVFGGVAKVAEFFMVANAAVGAMDS
jgi:hypothetical protein